MASSSSYRRLNESLVWLFGGNFMDKPLWARMNYLHTFLLLSTPVLGIWAVATIRAPAATYALAFAWYWLTGLGITAGYHRLWSHGAYRASLPVQLFLLFCGTGAFEGSVRWWARDHRAHHRYVDTPSDPYDVNQGFFYSHIGWMLIKQDPARIGRHDISDLNAQALLRFQHRYYLLLAPLISLGFPAAIAHMWGDAWGGLMIAGVARLVVVHHSTFCVNSLAHYFGDQKYTDAQSARNSIFTALVTFGEGYHEYHHEFPSDYRNGIRWYHWDPTKWLIRALSLLGGAKNLKRFPQNEIDMAVVQMQQKKLEARKRTINWGPLVEALPVWTLDDLAQHAAAGKQVVAFEGFVHDVSTFAADHPGGPAVMRPYIGKDATSAFGGGVYKHSTAARNLSRKYRIAKIGAIFSKHGANGAA